ncbi:hypothetical protein [Streptomyces sp. NPDC086989]
MDSLDGCLQYDVAPHMREADAANKAFRAGPVQVIELSGTPVA